MKEVYLHKFDMPRSCVDCDFRQNTFCKAQRIDDGEYVSCHQSKSRMKDGKPITCPLKCIESGELCDRKETAFAGTEVQRMAKAVDAERNPCRAEDPRKTEKIRTPTGGGYTARKE